MRSKIYIALCCHSVSWLLPSRACAVPASPRHFRPNDDVAASPHGDYVDRRRHPSPRDEDAAELLATLVQGCDEDTLALFKPPGPNLNVDDILGPCGQAVDSVDITRLSVTIAPALGTPAGLGRALSVVESPISTARFGLGPRGCPRGCTVRLSKGTDPERDVG